MTLEEAIYVLKRDTRRYAKRQLSWFRRDKRIQWFDLDRTRIEVIINQIQSKIVELQATQIVAFLLYRIRNISLH